MHCNRSDTRANVCIKTPYIMQLLLWKVLMCLCPTDECDSNSIRIRIYLMCIRVRKKMRQWSNHVGSSYAIRSLSTSFVILFLSYSEAKWKLLFQPKYLRIGRVRFLYINVYMILFFSNFPIEAEIGSINLFIIRCSTTNDINVRTHTSTI